MISLRVRVIAQLNSLIGIMIHLNYHFNAGL